MVPTANQVWGQTTWRQGPARLKSTATCQVHQSGSGHGDQKQGIKDILTGLHKARLCKDGPKQSFECQLCMGINIPQRTGLCRAHSELRPQKYSKGKGSHAETVLEALSQTNEVARVKHAFLYDLDGSLDMLATVIGPCQADCLHEGKQHIHFTYTMQ